MKYKIVITEKSKQIVDSMSFEELLNQVICNHSMPGDFSHISDFGSMFFHPTEIEELKEKIKILKDKCTYPPLITTDMENGPGSMIKGGTQFPQMLGCSVADSEDLAYGMGKSAALEGRELGYNWTLSPTVDLIGLHESPMVSTRSAGRNVEHAVRILLAYMNGIQKNGMMATLKHFPGDGFDIYDQHLTLVKNPLSKKEWNAISGRVFQELIDEGAMCVMPGHISLPSYDEIDKETGVYPPATLSKKILTDLLRDKMGFDGLIVSDAVNMSGMCGYMNYYKATALFLESGGDIILFPRVNDNFYKEMKKLYEQNILTKETLKNRVARILSLKEQIGLFEKSDEEIQVDKEKNKKIAMQIVDSCVSIVKDKDNLIPFEIQKNTKILHLIVTNNYQNEEELYQKFTKHIREYSDNVVELVNPGHGNTFFDSVYNKDYDLILCSIGNRYSFGTNVVRLHGLASRSMMQGWMHLGTPVIFISHFHPFVYEEYSVSIHTIINTYGSIDYTFERLMTGITGEKPLKKYNLENKIKGRFI